MFDVRSVLAALRGRDAAPPSAYARGLRLLEAGKPAEALPEFEAARRDCSTGPERAAADNKRGVALVALRRREEALAAFTQALASDERCAPALVNIGNLLLEDGHALDALDYYRAAITCDESHTLAHRNAAVALKRLGRRAEAVRAWRTAARLEGRRRRSHG